MNPHNKKWTGKRKENENNNKSKHYNGEWKKNVLIVLKGTQEKGPTQIKTHEIQKNVKKTAEATNIKTLRTHNMSLCNGNVEKSSPFGKQGDFKYVGR